MWASAGAKPQRSPKGVAFWGVAEADAHITSGAVRERAPDPVIHQGTSSLSKTTVRIFRSVSGFPSFHQSFFALGSFVSRVQGVGRWTDTPELSGSCRVHSMSGLLAMLLQEIHVQVTRRFNPVFVRLDGQRADQAQTTVRIRKDPHHECPPFDFFVQPLQHIRRLQVFVMRPRQFVQIDNQIPIVPSNDKCAIHGIRGVAVLLALRKQSRKGLRRFFAAVLRRPRTGEPWRYHIGCSKQPARR